jgi:hypothetical protein
VSTIPIRGELSGIEIPLTEQRFLLLAAIAERVGEEMAGGALVEAPRFDFPGGLNSERGFLLALSCESEVEQS